jgi:tetratricopeptide (TPR) repeat protein
VVAFLPALGAGFVTWDDNRNFLDNAAWRGLGPTELRWMWTTTHMGHYIPIAWMSLGLDYVLWGMNPLGYHLQNVVLHAVNAVLVYHLARRILRLGGVGAPVGPNDVVAPSVLAALVFAIHPLRVESVAWITERRDMLSLLWCLSSLLCYLRYVTAERPRPRWYLAAFAFFIAALLSKATSVTLPAALLVLNVYPLRRIGGAAGYVSPSARRVMLELVPFGVLSLGAGVVSVIALHPPAQLNVVEKVAVSAYSLAFYLWKTVVPTGLAPLYEMPQRVDAGSRRYVLSLVLVAAITVAAWAVRRRMPGVTAAWVAFLLVMLPMLGLVQNGPQIAADRYTYHAAPILGLLAGGAWSRWHGTPAWIRLAAPACVLGALGAATWHQTGHWRDSERLWSRVLSVDSTSSIAQIAMGDLLIAQGRAAEAAEHYGRGVELDPTYAEGHNNLGVALARDGRFAEAIAHYKAAIALDSSYADAYNNWGIALGAQGDLAGAIDRYARAIALDPRNADAQVNYGNALLRSGRPTDAIDRYRIADSVRPRHADTHLNWGVALAQLGRMSEAAEQFRFALELDPENVDARTYLARALGQLAPDAGRR